MKQAVIASVGDWVCFQRDARLVIGRVAYVEKSYNGVPLRYVTTCGDVAADYVLEVRVSPERTKGSSEHPDTFFAKLNAEAETETKEGEP